MSRDGNILKNIDWLTFALYIVLMLFGLFCINSATYDPEQDSPWSMLNLHSRAGRQLMWMGISVAFCSVFLLIDYKTYETVANIVYFACLAVLIVTPFLSHDTKGSLSWIYIGSFQFQPAEFAKIATALMIAKVMSRYGYKVRGWMDLIKPIIFVGLPMVIIAVWQKETGSALVFLAFFLVFYREGMTSYLLLFGLYLVVAVIAIIRFSLLTFPFGVSINLGYLIVLLLQQSIVMYYLFFRFHREKESLAVLLTTFIPLLAGYIVAIWKPFNLNFVMFGIGLLTILYLLFIYLFRYRRQEYLFLLLFAICSLGLAMSSKFIFNHLPQHHQDRIEFQLGMKEDIHGIGYNVNQARIAIGSGGLTGKGYLQGTQTKLKFVPEQATDFIFCTVGEEFGFIGCFLLLFIYSVFILRIFYVAERQKDKFSMIYIYSVACIFLFHVTINIGMVLGLLPVIGIPLPFLSYGGSSMLGFSILIFIYLRLDASRVEKMNG